MMSSLIAGLVATLLATLLAGVHSGPHGPPEDDATAADKMILLTLLDRRDLAAAAGFKKKPPERELPEEPTDLEEPEELEDPGALRVSLEKRSNSMSVVNSMDVMRERVLLELARRKAMEDQHVMGDNRHLLQYVGKRAPGPASGSTRPGDGKLLLLLGRLLRSADQRAGTD